MQKSKLKRGTRLSGRKWPFIVMSVPIFMLGNVIEAAFVSTQPMQYLSFDQVQIAVLALRLIPTLLQVLLIERFLKQSMRGWLVTTTIGTFITLFILTQSSSFPQQIEMVILVGFLTVFGPRTILQTLWLWRRFKQAWLWPIFMLLSGYVVPEALRVMSAHGNLFSIYGLVLAVIEALLLYHLLSHPKDAEKSKIDQAADEHSNAHHERLERLQERDTSNPLWDIGDDQTLQSEA
jgi:hypothetical protein